jgi:hypothetical protein
MRRHAYLILACVLAVLPQSVWAQRGEKWVVSWTGSAQGPYPIGNPSAQPDQKFAFPTPDTGARDQTFRLIVRPDLWGRQARLRLTNVFGTRPVTFDGVFVGLQVGGAAVPKASNRPVTFGSKTSVTVAPGASVWSDAVALGFVRNPAAPDLAGRKLSVSFHIAGESGPMTWHAKALQTSYRARQRIGRPVGGRRRVPLRHRLVVLSRRGRDDGAGHELCIPCRRNLKSSNLIHDIR